MSLKYYLNRGLSFALIMVLPLLFNACGSDEPEFPDGGIPGPNNNSGGGGSGSGLGGGPGTTGARPSNRPTSRPTPVFTDTVVPEYSCTLANYTNPVYTGPTSFTAPTNLGLGDQTIWSDAIRIGLQNKLTQVKVLYRTGATAHEDRRITLPFPFIINPTQNTANGAGGVNAGVGLYTSELPGQYTRPGYGEDIYEMVLPIGMPVLDLSNATTQSALSARNVTDYNIFHLGMNGGMLGSPIPAAVKYHWNGAGTWYWVLKNPHNIIFQRYSGTWQTSVDIQTEISTNGIYNYTARLKQALKKRVVDPNLAQEIIPTPLTQVHPVSLWSTIPSLQTCAVANAVKEGGNAQWRKDGSCGQYTPSGKTLIKDDVDKRFCENKFPTEFCLKSGTGKCLKVLKSDHKIVVEVDPNQSCWNAQTCK